MGRAAIALGTTDRCPDGLDRSGREIRQGRGSSADLPCGTPGTGGVLSRAAEGARKAPPLEATRPGRDVALHEIWFQLAPPDRQRFGHRFSAMVLKALGLRPCPTQEAES